MLTPVHFDDQTVFPADKIYNVRTDRLLPHKLHSVKGTRTESVPKSLFRDRGISAQLSRDVRLCNFCATHEAAPVMRNSRQHRVGHRTGLGKTVGI
jgi:hypothetical protein